jgi:agmatinase
MTFAHHRARFGPTGIRLGSRRLSKGFNTDSETGFNALNDWATIVDCGDVLALLIRGTDLRRP